MPPPDPFSGAFCSGDSPQCCQQRFVLLPAVLAAVQMILHQGQGCGGILPSQYHIDKIIHLLETLVTADLVRASGGLVTDLKRSR